MKRTDFKKLVKRIGSVNLISEVGGPVPDKGEIASVIDSLTHAIVLRNVIQTGPKRNTDADLPELKEAILKIIYIYHTNHWLIDDNLFVLLLWTLHSGSKSRRSQQRDENKYRFAATMEAVWLQKYKESIPEAKLARNVGVSRTTVRRWRKEDAYIDGTKIIIENDSFINEIMKYIK